MSGKDFDQNSCRTDLEARFLQSVEVVTKRGKEFEFELTIYTTTGVDTANLKSDIVDERTAEITRK